MRLHHHVYAFFSTIVKGYGNKFHFVLFFFTRMTIKKCVTGEFTPPPPQEMKYDYTEMEIADWQLRYIMKNINDIIIYI